MKMITERKAKRFVVGFEHDLRPFITFIIFSCLIYTQSRSVSRIVGWSKYYLFFGDYFWIWSASGSATNYNTEFKIHGDGENSDTGYVYQVEAVYRIRPSRYNILLVEVRDEYGMNIKKRMVLRE